MELDELADWMEQAAAFQTELNEAAKAGAQ
jgi:hypothetical protein